MKRAELKKVVKYTISDTVSVGEMKAVREFAKLVKTDVERILGDPCGMLEEEGINRRFYVWEYSDADITFYDSLSAVVTVQAYGRDCNDKLHEYVIYSTVCDDLSMYAAAIVSVDGVSYSTAQYSL